MGKNLIKIKEYLRKIKHKELLIAGILGLILVVIYFTSNIIKTEETSSNNTVNGNNYCASMSADILDAVELMTNSKNCKVIINWEAGVENVIAYTTSSTSGGVTQTPEIISTNGQSSPIILKEQFPKAISVAVVCPQNTSVQTKLNIKYMVGTLLEIDVNNIAIYNC